jgi:hypothetical protein
MSSSEETSQSPMCTYIGQVCHHHYKPVNQCMPSSTVFDTHHLGGKLVLQDGLWSQSNIYRKLSTQVVHRRTTIDHRCPPRGPSREPATTQQAGVGSRWRNMQANWARGKSITRLRTNPTCVRGALGFVQITSFSYRNHTIPTLSHWLVRTLSPLWDSLSATQLFW